MPLASVDKLSANFEKNMLIVLDELNNQLVAILSDVTTKGTVDATALLNSKAQMLQALQDAGYYGLAASQGAGYVGIVDSVGDSLKARGIPAPKYNTVDKDTLKQLAAVDIEGIANIGQAAIEELNTSLYKNALSGTRFSDLVAEIKDKIEGPLKNHAYTYANTANLNFSGEVLRVAGESLGATHWEVVGPLDEVTRDVCQDALSDPVRTQKEWISADYFGGTPGGWNCRHQLYPVVT